MMKQFSNPKNINTPRTLWKVMTTLLLQTIKSFVTLFIILDPFLGLAAFISLIKGMNGKEKAKQAFVASSVAFVLLIVFMFLGMFILDLLDVTFPAFKVAGGIILLILGIQAVLGIEFSKKSHNQKAAAIIIGTPLLCGPGAMTTIIVLSQQYGYIPPLCAAVLAMLITWLLLFFADRIQRLLGERLIEVFSRVMGLLLTAIAAEFIINGITEMVKNGILH
jgi:multiple antibiotic resistance protein